MQLGREDLPLGLLLTLLGDQFRLRVYEGYAAAGFGDIRPPHDVVFALLNGKEDRVVDLAKRGYMTKQAMGYLVGYLEQRGYVERVPDPNDKRAQLVQRTARGWKVTQLSRQLILEVQAEWAAQLGDVQMEQLIAMLRDLVKKV